MSGQWAQVRQPDGTVRQDWVPAEQPPSPDGSAGSWHVVENGPGQPTHWEWHPGTEPPAPAVALGRPIEPPNDQRAVLVVGAIWGTFFALLPGIRTPLTTTWEKVNDTGSAGQALLLTILVALYVLIAAGIAWVFALAFNRPPSPARRLTNAS